MTGDLDELTYMMWLKTCGYQRITPLPGNRWVALQPLMFHWSMIIGKIGDMTSYDDRYCFASRPVADAALDDWIERGFDGEPQFWHRHPKTGRRRAEGDPEAETINW